MLMFDIAFGTTDWEGVERTEHPGETGKAYWRTRTFNNIRVRMVEYTPGYLADHWCQKGHVLLVLDGELHTELADGRTVVLTRGQSYQVADGAWPIARAPKAAPNSSSWTSRRNEGKACICYILPWSCNSAGRPAYPG